MFTNISHNILFFLDLKGGIGCMLGCMLALFVCGSVVVCGVCSGSEWGI